MLSTNHHFQPSPKPHFRPWIMLAALLWLLLILAACSDRASDPKPLESDEETVSRSDTVTAEGFRGVRFGMTAEEARAAYPGGLGRLGDFDGPPGECYYIGPDGTNYDIAFMLVSGTVQRIDIRTAGIETEAGAAVGMTLDAVEMLYPDATRQPNKYAPEQSNLIADLEDGVRAVFEEDAAGMVRSYRVGLPPPVDYVEGCA